MGERTWESAGAVAARSFTRDALHSRPPRLKTGFSKLDALLGGGITPGVMVLGASPGLGKSTLALQIAANVSSGENRVPVLLYSLEMPRDRLVAKLQSRQLFQWGVQKRGLPANLEAAASYLTADAFFQPETTDKLDDAAWAEIYMAQQEIGELYIRDNLRSAEEIRQDVQSFREDRAKGGDTRAPMVIVDYLQILSNPTGRRSVGERQVVEENLNQLSVLARGSDGVPLLLISSLSRAGYGGPVRMENFKETGGIEYNADLLLGLQFTAANESAGLDLTALKNKFPREVELVALKQRYGSSGGRVKLLYYAPFDCFLEPSAPISTGASAPVPTAQTVEKTAPKTPEPVSVPAAAAGEKSALEKPADKEKKAETAPPEKTTGKRRSPIGYFNNTKVANEIRKGHQERVEDGWTKCEVSREGAEDKLYVRYRLSGPISAFDMDVLDALSTLWEQSEETFTARQLLVALTGDSAITATKQKVEEVRDVLQRLRTTEITLDCTDEIVARKGAQPGEQVLVQGPMVSLEDNENGYRFAKRDVRELIPLWWYAGQLGQVISFPQVLLSAREKGARKPQDTVESILLKRLLIRRLEIYRANTHLSMNVFRCVPKNRARDQGLLRQLGIYEGDLRSNPVLNKAVKRVHEKLLQEMERLQKLGYIAAYQALDADGIKVVSLGTDPMELFEIIR